MQSHQTKTNQPPRKRSPSPTFADVATDDFAALEQLVKNLLVENKNHLNGYYQNHYSSGSRFYREVLTEQLLHIENRVEAVAGELIGLADCLREDAQKHPENEKLAAIPSLGEEIGQQFISLGGFVTSMREMPESLVGKSTRQVVSDVLPAIQAQLICKIRLVKDYVVDGFVGALRVLDEMDGLINKGGSMNQYEFLSNTADRWQLYDKPGRDIAASELNAAFNELVSTAFVEMSKGVAPHQALANMEAAFDKHLSSKSDFGATDGESSHAFELAMAKVFGDELRQVGKITTKTNRLSN